MTADDRAVRYLLGELPEPEREALEEEYFTTEDAFEELKAAEEDLIDAYCRGTLPPERRPAFEARYLETESGRARLEFARALGTVTAGRRSAPATRRLGAWGTWAAVLAAMALGAGLVVSRAQLVRERGEARTEREERQRSAADQERHVADLRAQGETLRAEVARLERALAAAGLERMVSLVLSAGLQRDGGVRPRLVLERTSETLRLTLQLKTDPYASYQVSLQTADGVELWRSKDVRAQDGAGGRALVVFVPAAALKSQHVVVVVRGRSQPPSDTHAEFAFEIQRAR